MESITLAPPQPPNTSFAQTSRNLPASPPLNIFQEEATAFLENNLRGVELISMPTDVPMHKCIEFVYCHHVGSSALTYFSLHTHGLNLKLLRNSC